MSTTEPDAAAPIQAEGRQESRRPRELTEDLVAAWIFDNPEIVSKNNKLLTTLDPPDRFAADATAKVVDLQQVMIRRLQIEAERQAKFGRALIQAGESNQDAQARVHRAVLLLLEARGFEPFLETLNGPVAKALGLCAIAIGVEAPEGERPPASLKSVAALSHGSVDRLIGTGNPARLRDNIDRTRGLPPGPFGPRARDIRSDALVRLNLGRGLAPALLALGSTSAELFKPDQGVDLVLFLAGVIERLIGQWLDLPPA
jgi:uncharacterized protein YigA (DUF484 family)